MEGVHIKADATPVIDAGETPNYGHFSFETEEYDQRQGGLFWVNYKETGNIIDESYVDNLGNLRTKQDFHANSSELSVGPVSIDPNIFNTHNVQDLNIQVENPMNSKMQEKIIKNIENTLAEKNLKNTPQYPLTSKFKAEVAADKIRKGSSIPINAGYSQGTMHKFSLKATF